MKKNINIALAVIVSATLVSCNALKKMAKRMDEVKYEVTPNPMEMHGEQIEITVSGSFPEKYFHKKVHGVITPILKYDGGEEKFASFALKGEDSEAEGTVIKYEAGGKFTHTAKIPYKDGMDVATLDLSLEGFYKKKTKVFDPIKVADGTVITPRLVRSDDKPILGKDEFKPKHPKSIFADINYIVNTTSPVSGDLSKDDIKNLQKKVKELIKNPKIVFTQVYTEAYASPEGELSKNDNLANERAEHGGKTIGGYLKSAKIEAAKAPEFYVGKGKGEDWDGFKKLMTASEIKDKELILRVLEMYTDLTKREEEIKNMAATYQEVAKKILPELRRSENWVKYDSLSRTNEEINALLGSDYKMLTAEEILYAATLTNDLGEKEAIYKKFVDAYPNDWRGPNNIGYIHVMKNSLGTAKTEFEKADKLKASNPIVMNNMGVIARLNGDLDAAMEYYNKASGAGSEVNHNKGIVNIIQGNYADAVSNFGGTSSFNGALAQTLNGNPDGAAKTIDNSDAKDDADAYYLKAIVGARTSNKDMLVNNLKTAISKDSKFKEKAKRDAEFIKYRSDSEFQAATN